MVLGRTDALGVIIKSETMTWEFIIKSQELEFVFNKKTWMVKGY